MPKTALLIGPASTLERLERQLDLLPDRPVSIGWVLTGAGCAADARGPVLGREHELETIVARRRPNLALISLPAVMHEQITRLRTRLRRLGVPDRFMPTLEDQIDGRGPRAWLDVDHAALLDRPRRTVDETSVRGVIEGRRVLITGAGGSIGGELARIVARFAPSQLLLMDRAENALFEIDRQIARRAPGVARRALLHDVCEVRATLEEFRALQPEIVFHAAAHKHVPMMENHPAAAVDNNLFGTRSVADAAAAVGTGRFVMISTDKAVNPTSIMGATKRMAELYVQDINRRSATAFSMVRFGNVLGSAGSVLETWSRQIADGGPMTITDPAMTRYFMTIPEAAALVIESAALVDPTTPNGEVFLLDMGAPVRIVDMAERFIRMHGLEPLHPGHAGAGCAGTMQIVFTGARPGEKLHEELAFDSECMQPTRHPDINIWVLPAPEPDFVRDLVTTLSPECRETDAGRLAATIRTLLPEMAEAIAA